MLSLAALPDGLSCARGTASEAPSPTREELPSFGGTPSLFTVILAAADVQFPPETLQTLLDLQSISIKQ